MNKYSILKFLFFLMVSKNILASETVKNEMSVNEMFTYAKTFDVSQADPILKPDTLWSSIEEQEWPEMLNPVFEKLKTDRSYVLLFNKLPFSPMDMRSADRFKRSMINSFLKDDISIGHMTVGWACATDKGHQMGLTAQTGEHSGQSTYMNEMGWGLNSMLSTFTDGNMNTPEDIQRYFSTSYVNSLLARKKAVPFFPLLVEVSNDECQSVKHFVKEYIFHENQPMKNFSMVLNPEKFEGGGCGSFAISALSQAHSLKPLMDTFWRTVSVPKGLMGIRQKDDLSDETILFHGKPAESSAQEKKISRAHLLLSNWDKKRNSLDVKILDPELVIYSFRNFINMALETQQAKASKFQKFYQDQLRRTFNFGGNANFDGNSFQNADLGFREIDSELDESFKKVMLSSYNTVSAGNYKIQTFSFPLGQGAILAK